MPAWFVITTQVHDREAFVAGGYSAAVAKLAEAYGARYLLRGRAGRVLEGEGYEGGGAVVMEWPDADAALAFWNSSEYAEVKKLRQGIADVSVTLVEG
ncbi:hypothetical protein WSK_0797 [Novosphingobium sp. Rr 2-17]|uniref:DUF1330 domain-containing protein n=1 Tax=Novosphingobium sp. Rr 2-17 TaxID=555793 RepID=UPI00026984CF|nr:DUF1330 domain-containing protein [Novosphingobium sp. Rr 2-17]EIZ80518.1 hypothetical protein WSK_0797 [Novosphingobium sp. Rr 2-17]